MNRLLQGDVGSGKTAVASYGLFTCALNGYKAVMMVPHRDSCPAALCHPEAGGSFLWHSSVPPDGGCKK